MLCSVNGSNKASLDIAAYDDVSTFLRLQTTGTIAVNTWVYIVWDVELSLGKQSNAKIYVDNV